MNFFSTSVGDSGTRKFLLPIIAEFGEILTFFYMEFSEAVMNTVSPTLAKYV